MNRLRREGSRGRAQLARRPSSGGDRDPAAVLSYPFTTQRSSSALWLVRAVNGYIPSWALGLLLVAIALSSCGSGDPCDGAICGQNALCVDGVCVCAAGFEGNPYTGCYSLDPCAGVTCGENASCADGACVCKEGFTGDPVTGCEPAHPCAGVTCGDNASCVDGTCVCDEGFAGNPSTGCVPADPCAGVTCGANASCENGACVCDEGFEEDFFGECVPEDPCNWMTCGANASCVDGACVCDEGFEGDPQTGCVPVDACAGVTCGDNASCVEGACVCDEGFEGDPQTGCEPAGPPPPVFSDLEIGVRYHSLVGSPSLFGATFINDYHLGDNRVTAIGQMQEMVDQGATLIHLTIWPAGGPPSSWGSHFPLSEQELDNLADFVSDVRDVRSESTGIAPRLHISLLDGGDSQFKTVEENDVFPIAAGGSRDGTEFLAAWRKTIDDLIDRVSPIRYVDDTPVVQRIYLGGELMLHENGSSPYDGAAGWVLQWFLTNTFPHFWDACEAAGIEPSTYFFAWPIVAEKIFDGSWLDIVESTLTWWQNNLADYVPDRLDISVYTGDHSIPDYTADQRLRILATAAALDDLTTRVFGPAGRDYAFVEAHYYHVEADHPNVRQEAFGTYRDMMDPGHADHHPRFRGVHFWPYPYSILGGPNVNGAAPPFDIELLVP